MWFQAKDLSCSARYLLVLYKPAECANSARVTSTACTRILGSKANPLLREYIFLNSHFYIQEGSPRASSIDIVGGKEQESTPLSSERSCGCNAE